jgi:SAM-dependent methyltransferase
MTDNSEQIEYWNGKAGDTWTRGQERLDAMLTELSALAIQRADPQPGERVIDVGCGCGATSIAIAEAGASVWGIDISEPMLARAKERAAELDNVAFAKTDATTQILTPDHQLIFSRFGVMFFADPVAAFANLRSGLTEDGRLVFVCWQAPRANPWVSIAGRVIQPFLAEGDAPDPRAPGPFAFADEDYLRGILEQAGYGNIELDGINIDMHIGDDLESAMQSQGEVGPVARALAELSGDNKDQALAAVRAAFAPLLTDAGLNLGAAVWLVCATKNP